MSGSKVETNQQNSCGEEIGGNINLPLVRNDQLTELIREYDQDPDLAIMEKVFVMGWVKFSKDGHEVIEVMEPKKPLVVDPELGSGAMNFMDIVHKSKSPLVLGSRVGFFNDRLIYLSGKNREGTELHQAIAYVKKDRIDWTGADQVVAQLIGVDRDRIASLEGLMDCLGVNLVEGETAELVNDIEVVVLPTECIYTLAYFERMLNREQELMAQGASLEKYVLHYHPVGLTKESIRAGYFATDELLLNLSFADMVTFLGMGIRVAEVRRVGLDDASLPQLWQTPRSQVFDLSKFSDEYGEIIGHIESLVQRIEAASGDDLFVARDELEKWFEKLKNKNSGDRWFSWDVVLGLAMDKKLDQYEDYMTHRWEAHIQGLPPIFLGDSAKPVYYSRVQDAIYGAMAVDGLVPGREVLEAHGKIETWKMLPILSMMMKNSHDYCLSDEGIGFLKAWQNKFVDLGWFNLVRVTDPDVLLQGTQAILKFFDELKADVQHRWFLKQVCQEWGWDIEAVREWVRQNAEEKTK